jgi:hypothetical protein
MPAVEYDDEALRFFNKLSGRLDVRLSEATQPISEGLLNRAAPPAAQIEGVSLSLRVFEDIEADDFRDLTEEEWNRVVLRAPVILLCGLDERVVEHRAPDGVAFTVRDLAAAIAETERQTRGATNWFGGVDVHHVYFEGLMLDDDGVWTIGWGS